MEGEARIADALVAGERGAAAAGDGGQDPTEPPRQRAERERAGRKKTADDTEESAAAGRKGIGQSLGHREADTLGRHRFAAKPRVVANGFGFRRIRRFPRGKKLFTLRPIPK